jgi:hypothetical protein
LSHFDLSFISVLDSKVIAKSDFENLSVELISLFAMRGLAHLSSAFLPACMSVFIRCTLSTLAGGAEFNSKQYIFVILFFLFQEYNVILVERDGNEAGQPGADVQRWLRSCVG